MAMLNNQGVCIYIYDTCFHLNKCGEILFLFQASNVGATIPLIIAGKLTACYGKSPSLMGKSPFLMGKSPSLMGKSTINGTFSIATWSYQRLNPEFGPPQQPDFFFYPEVPPRLGSERPSHDRGRRLWRSPQSGGWFGTFFILHSHGITGPFIDGLPIKNGDFPWLC